MNKSLSWAMFLNRRVAALVIIGLLVCVLAMSRAVRVELQETVLSKLYDEETVFAPGYSKKSWNAVRIGDTEDRVIQLLGEPLSRDQGGDGSRFYRYSAQGPRNTNYRARGIFFSASGRVARIKAEFYLD